MNLKEIVDIFGIIFISILLACCSVLVIVRTYIAIFYMLKDFKKAKTFQKK